MEKILQHIKEEVENSTKRLAELELESPLNKELMMYHEGKRVAYNRIKDLIDKETDNQ